MFRGGRILHRELKVYLNLNRSYLSQEFKSVADKQVSPPFSADELQPLQSFRAARAINVDTFVTGARNSTEDRRADISDLMLKLRSEETATSAFESTSFAAIKYFADAGDIEQLIAILQDRLHYGIFVDNYTGCYLMDQLLQTQDYKSAADIAIELMLQEDCHNELVIALSLKSLYEHFKKVAASPPEDTPPLEKDTRKEEKVRVKFIRNTPKIITDKNYWIGKTMQKMAVNCKDNEIKTNMNVLGMLLCGQQEAFVTSVKGERQTLYKDVLALSDTFLKNSGKGEEQQELWSALTEQLAKTTKTQSFDEKLNQLIEQVLPKEEPKLIAHQKETFQKWDTQRQNELKSLLELHDKQLRQQNLENITNEINTVKQKLFVFDNEEEIDLQIFKNKEFLPKREFGKKKKPRAIDANYVPPEVRRK